MPININSVGSAGVGNSPGGSGGSILYQTPMTEQPSGSNTGNYQFSDNFISTSSTDYANDRFRNYMYISQKQWNTVNNHVAPHIACYINHNLYVMDGPYNPDGNTHIPPGCTVTRCRNLYKFTNGTYNTQNSTLTSITSLPFKDDHYILRNPSLIRDNDWILIGGSRGYQSDYGGAGGIEFISNSYTTNPVYAYIFNGTTWTQLFSVIDIWKETLNGGNYNTSITYAYIYNAIRIKTHLYLIMDSPELVGDYYSKYLICVDYDLSTSKILTTYKWNKVSQNIYYNNNIAILSDMLYEEYVNISSDDSGYNTFPYIRKWKNNFPTSFTLTSVSANYINSSSCTNSNVDTYQELIYRLSEDHYIMGIAAQSKRTSSEYSRWLIHKNTMEIYIDPKTGTIVEHKPFISTHYGDYQLISYPYFSESSVQPTIFRSCIAFDVDKTNNVLQFSLNSAGINNEHMVQYTIPNFKNYTLIGGGGNTLTGYFENGDTVYCSGTITSITGDYTIASINTKKYKITKSGNIVVHAESDDLIPSFIVVSSNGSVLYAYYDYTDGTLKLNTIAGMSCNGITISESKRDYSITDSRLNDRLIIDMKGVH